MPPFDRNFEHGHYKLLLRAPAGLDCG